MTGKNANSKMRMTRDDMRKGLVVAAALLLAIQAQLGGDHDASTKEEGA